MRFVIALALVVTLFTSGLAVAQEKVPDPAPGLEGSAGRAFRMAAPRTGTWRFIEVRIAQFETEQHAEAAAGMWLEQMKADPIDSYRFDHSDMAPVSVEQLADGSRAWIGFADGDDGEDDVASVAFLTVVDGNLLYTFAIWESTSYTDTLGTLVGVAEQSLDLANPPFEPVPGIPYQSGGLWDLLPRIEHMPQGMTWRMELVPCLGVVGANDCQAPATPVSSPIATP